MNTPRVRRALVDSTNARRTRGVFPCRVCRALVDLANVLLRIFTKIHTWTTKFAHHLHTQKQSQTPKQKHLHNTHAKKFTHLNTHTNSFKYIQTCIDTHRQSYPLHKIPKSHLKQTGKIQSTISYNKKPLHTNTLSHIRTYTIHVTNTHPITHIHKSLHIEQYPNTHS